MASGRCAAAAPALAGSCSYRVFFPASPRPLQRRPVETAAGPVSAELRFRRVCWRFIQITDLEAERQPKPRMCVCGVPLPELVFFFGCSGDPVRSREPVCQRLGVLI